MKITIATLAILMLLASMALATDFGRVGSDTGQVSMVTPRTETILRLYDPDPGNISFFRAHKLIVYSRTSRNGEQVDVVRRGNFDKECFVGKDGKIHVYRCGNQVYQIAVEETIVCPAGPAGRNGQNGYNGAPGAEGPQGPEGPQGQPGPGTIVNNYSFNTVPVMSCQIGGAYAPMIVSTQLGGINWIPSNPINIDIVNNNANSNTNVNANNNVLNIGDGTASGSAAGSGGSTAGAGNGN